MTFNIQYLPGVLCILPTSFILYDKEATGQSIEFVWLKWAVSIKLNAKN